MCVGTFSFGFLGKCGRGTCVDEMLDIQAFHSIDSADPYFGAACCRCLLSVAAGLQIRSMGVHHAG